MRLPIGGLVRTIVRREPMAILIVNNSERPQGLVVGERVLIGRRPFNTIMVPDPTVSRIHAWIGRRDGQYVLFDAGSRAGTVVNGEAVTTPRPLADGDEIVVGTTTLTYMDADELPHDVEPLEPPPAPPAADPYDGGIYFDCACGGPMWVSMEMAGRAGRCRYCGERLVVPHLSGLMARPVSPVAAATATANAAARPPRRSNAGVAATVLATPPPPPPELQTALCSICQTPILTTEERTACPSCHLTFHAQCWAENFGCSAYGCDQVNVLAPPEDGRPQEPAATEDGVYSQDTAATPLAPPHGFPWEPVLLALAFVATGLGAPAYGIPPVAIVLWAGAFLLMRKGRRKGLVAAALLIALAGCVAGYVTSMFLWKGVRVWETMLK
jgi:hypothetical protein